MEELRNEHDIVETAQFRCFDFSGISHPVNVFLRV